MKTVLLTTIAVLGFVSITIGQPSCRESIKLEASNEQLANNIKMNTETWDYIFNNGGDIEYVNDKYFDSELRLRNQKTENIYSTGIKGFKKCF